MSYQNNYNPNQYNPRPKQVARPEVNGQWIHRDTFEIYNTVITNVIKNIKPIFYDESLDDEVIDHLRHLWIEKLNDTRVLAQPEEYIPRQIVTKRLENESRKPTSVATNIQNDGSRPRYVVGNQAPETEASGVAESVQEPVNKQPRYRVDGHNDLDTFEIKLDSSSESEEESDQNESSSSSESEKEEEKEVSSSSSSESSGGKLAQEEKPLGSDDDLSNDEDIFTAENTMLCQYDVVRRNKGRWTIKLTNGVMNVRNRDYIFTKASGEVAW